MPAIVKRLPLVAALAGLAVIFGAVHVPGQAKMPRIVIETESGTVEADIDPVHAPMAAANFLKYVDGGFNNGGQFWRTVKAFNQPGDAVKIEAIQGGINPTRRNEGFLPIPLDRTSVTGRTHRHGTLSMARGNPDSATSDFFICMGDQPSLDSSGVRNPDGQGFAAFGPVTQGMDIVIKNQRAPAKEQKLTPPIRIISMQRIK